ncbi:MAG: pyrroline-5-carboxylate reductase [Anaerovorax sp.]|nr:pyrroline-5-carboxylate reductase [Anaerovorax sp.]
MKIGFIGTGNMGCAIIKGYLKANPKKADFIYVYNHHVEKAQALQEELGIHNTNSIKELVDKTDIVVLAVKPNTFEQVMPQVAAAITTQKTLVSIAAGVSISYLEGFMLRGVGVIRVMPNTPSLVGEGMASVSRNKAVCEEAFTQVLELFSSIGMVQEISENLIDAVVGVSGSSPAYAYMFIEALADGAVAEGMQRKQAYIFAAQSVLGAAKMVLETGLHPGELKDQVCSPGGTTIEAVRSLEKSGLRSSVMEAVHICAEKSKNMSK